MPERSRSLRQLFLILLATAAALVLVIGAIRAVVTGESPIWLLGTAIVLVASLMLITALRRNRD